MLLPKNTEAAKVLELLVGAQVVKNQTHYSPDGKYTGEFYFDGEVVQSDQDRISVSCVPDKDVMTADEWAAKCDAADAKYTAQQCALPVAA